MRRIVGILTLVVLGGGCVLKSEHDATLAQNARLASDQAKLAKEREQFKTDLEAAQTKLAEVEARNEELSNTNQMLAAKNADYARRAQETTSELLKVKDERQQEAEKIAFASKTYEDLVRTLKTEIESGEIEISSRGERLSVNVSEKVLFPSGSSRIQASGRSVLAKVVPILKQTRGKEILVEGHTDNIPISGPLRRKFPTNWELSTARATEVVRFFETGGIDPAQLVALGFGPNRPITDNATPQARQRNRRIEIVLRPLVQDRGGRP